MTIYKIIGVMKNMDTSKMCSEKVTEILYQELREFLKSKQIKPTVVSISIGNAPDSAIYAKVKQRQITNATEIQFHCVHFQSITYHKIIEYIRTLNEDKTIHGIMIQLPLPSSLKKYERKILDTIDPKKDVDGLTTISAGKLSTGFPSLISCTALGIEVLLKSYQIHLEGKLVAIISRSHIVGKPLIQLMLSNHATPIICHSKTDHLKQITQQCDIVIVACNKPEYITSEYIKKGAVVIDVGVHKNSQGKIVGDVNYQQVSGKAQWITPPIGGVGPMTTCMLAYNTAQALYGEKIKHILKIGLSKIQNMI